MIAVIDIGTNTFHLLIIDPNSHNPYHPICRKKRYVKLAEGGFGYIIPAALERGLETMSLFKNTIEQYPVTQIHALATEGVRRATNGQTLIDAVKKQTDIQIKCISGDDEAKYIYYGIQKAVPLDHQTVLMMDIGGGSVEFILCNHYQIFWQRSFPIGASVLYHLFQKTDPISPPHLNDLQQHLHQTLAPLWHAHQQYPTNTLIGSSGTFDSIRDMQLAKNKITTPINNTHYHIETDFFHQITPTLLQYSLQQRLQIVGMESQRADMMPAGVALVDTVVRQLNIKHIIQSEYAIKEGIIAQLLNK